MAADRDLATSFKAGAVLYAKRLAPVRAFYQAVAGLAVQHAEDDHVVLASESFELTILQVPPAIASSIEIASPPHRRTETPIKLVFLVASIADALAAAMLQGGELNPAERGWQFGDDLVCDKHDPEGNVVPFRLNSDSVNVQ